MKTVARFKFLKMELGKTKKDSKEYAIVSLLDEDANSLRFFVFDKLKDKFIGSVLKEFEEIDCVLDISMYNNLWNLKIAEFERVEK